MDTTAATTTETRYACTCSHCRATLNRAAKKPGLCSQCKNFIHAYAKDPAEAHRIYGR